MFTEAKGTRAWVSSFHFLAKSSCMYIHGLHNGAANCAKATPGPLEIRSGRLLRCQASGHLFRYSYGENPHSLQKRSPGFRQEPNNESDRAFSIWSLVPLKPAQTPEIWHLMLTALYTVTGYYCTCLYKQDTLPLSSFPHTSSSLYRPGRHL